MRKVIIIQRTSYFDDIISKLVTADDIEIVGITASSDIQKNQINSYYPDIPVFTHQEIYNWTKSFVTQSEIQTYYQTQLKVERNYFRIFKGSAHIMSIYYSALAFWLNLFNNPIDCVIVREIEHGSPIDSVPMDIAKKRNIPVFNIEVVSEQTTRSVWGIRSYNSERYVNLSELDEKLPKLDVKSYLFSAQSIKFKEHGKYSHQAKINNTFSGLFLYEKNLSQKII